MFPIGVGGVGRYDVETKSIEIRRPPRLRGVSVNHILVEGSRLWVGTTGRGECVGQPAAERLVVYDWGSDRTLNLGQHEGMCGFARSRSLAVLLALQPERESRP